MNWWNILFSSFFILWLFLIAWLLWQIMQQNLKRSQHLEGVITDTILKSLDTLEQSVDTLKRAVDLLQQLKERP